MSIRPTTQGVFPKLIYPFYGEVSLGNSTAYKMGVFKNPDGRLFLGIEGKGAYVFSGWCHWSYVQEKLSIRWENDARNVADFINCQLDHEGVWLGHDKPQGQYDPKMCEVEL